MADTLLSQLVGAAAFTAQSHRQACVSLRARRSSALVCLLTPTSQKAPHRPPSSGARLSSSRSVKKRGSVLLMAKDCSSLTVVQASVPLCSAWESTTTVRLTSSAGVLLVTGHCPGYVAYTMERANLSTGSSSVLLTPRGQRQFWLNHSSPLASSPHRQHGGKLLTMFSAACSSWSVSASVGACPSSKRSDQKVFAMGESRAGCVYSFCTKSRQPRRNVRSPTAVVAAVTAATKPRK
mmetsp:Transcript_11823/g.36557  ORF Transcript_11823/g.36557 Transcript_11823/m.36557 type:complete len:237 (+) Transcript_11823:388-1098(+)